MVYTPQILRPPESPFSVNSHIHVPICLLSWASALCQFNSHAPAIQPNRVEGTHFSSPTEISRREYGLETRQPSSRLATSSLLPRSGVWDSRSREGSPQRAHKVLSRTESGVSTSLTLFRFHFLFQSPSSVTPLIQFRVNTLISPTAILLILPR